MKTRGSESSSEEKSLEDPYTKISIYKKCDAIVNFVKIY